MENKASKEAVSAALTAVKVQYDSAMAASSKAIDKADAATEKRFDSVNEFRKTLSDQATNFLGRLEYEANHNALTDRISALTSRFDTWEGKAKGMGEGWGILVAAGGLAVGILIAVASYIR